MDDDAPEAASLDAVHPVSLAVFLCTVLAVAYYFTIQRPRLARRERERLLLTATAEAVRAKRLEKLNALAPPVMPAAVRAPRMCKPIESVVALLAWTEADGPQDRPAAKAKRTARNPSIAVQQRRVLACHDMAGNYSVDAWVDGWYPATVAQADEAANWPYAFRPTTFALMDVFVYFSHHMVSVPPRGWIDAAHLHGCAVFGTLLTEWDAGAEACKALFSSPEATAAVAAQLERVRVAHGFDGWLVNVENKLEPGAVANVLVLLERLPGALWYDSVVKTGELHWQDALTAENRCFFDAARVGLFTNYGWDAAKLQGTCAEAGARLGDVWHGVDVFGRQTMGGGGMAVDVPLHVLTQHACASAALFAVGWTLEVAANRDAALARRCQQDFGRVVAGAGWGNSVDLVAVRAPTFTDWCDGGGRGGYWVQGRRASTAPWMDLRRQTLQADCDALDAGGEVACRYRESAPVFGGGGCVQVVGRSGLGAQGGAQGGGGALRLVSLDLRLGGGPHSMLSVTVALFHTHGDISLVLDIEQRQPSGEGASRLVLVPWEGGVRARDALRSRGPDEAVAGTGWRLRRFVLKTGALRGRRLVGVGVLPRRGFVDVRVGLLALAESDAHHDDGGGSLCNARAAELPLITWECTRHGTLPCRCWAQVHVYDAGEWLCCAFGKQCALTRAFSGVLKLRAVGWEGLEGAVDVIVDM